MKMPKKPRPAKMPKKPKLSASASVWIRYDERCKDVHRKNADKLKDWHKKVSEIKQKQARKLAIIRKHKA